MMEQLRNQGPSAEDEKKRQMRENIEKKRRELEERKRAHQQAIQQKYSEGPKEESDVFNLLNANVTNTEGTGSPGRGSPRGRARGGPRGRARGGPRGGRATWT